MSARRCPMIHCWGENCDDSGTILGVCLLEIDHDGPHQFFPAEDVRIQVMEAKPE